MNWRHGFFRLWIVGAALFVIAVAVISYGEIKAQFNAVTPPPPPQGSEILAPQSTIPHHRSQEQRAGKAL
jgi:hypothetical protein